MTNSINSRNCAARMKKISDGDTPFRSIAIALTSKTLRTYFSENLQNKRLPMKALPIYSPAVPLPHNIKVDSLFMSLVPYADQNVDPDEETIRSVQNAAIRCLLEIDERMFPTLFDFHETWKIDLLDFMEHHFTEDMTMEDYANFEKVGNLPASLPTNDEQITTAPGDIILYLGKHITIYYDVNTWNFTRLGKIDDISKDELKKILGKGSVTVTFSIKQ